jgi:hypothetical protein
MISDVKNKLREAEDFEVQPKLLQKQQSMVQIKKELSKKLEIVALK